VVNGVCSRISFSIHETEPEERHWGTHRWWLSIRG